MIEHDIHEADMQRYLAADNDDDEVLLDPQVRELESAQIAAAGESRSQSKKSVYAASVKEIETEFAARNQSTGYYMPEPDHQFYDNNGTHTVSAAQSRPDSNPVQELPRPPHTDGSWSIPAASIASPAESGGKDGKAEASLPATPKPDHEGFSTENDASPSRMTPTSQLQTMADLLHRHQMKQIERSRRLATSEEPALQPSEQELSQDKAIAHVQADTTEPALCTLPEASTAEPSTSGPQFPNANSLAVTASETGAFSHTVLGKRKDRPYTASIPDEEQNSIRNSEATIAPDDVEAASSPVGDNGKKRRAARKRKPLAESSSRGRGSKAGKPPPPVPQAQRLKRESRRRWTSLEPYITLMMMLLRTLLGQQGWLALVEGVAKVSPPDEQKDAGRIKQTWANEYTRLKSRGAKGRLVTLRDLSCSWPWNMEEKKQLWLTGIELCVYRADWDAVTAQVNKSAKAVGEGEVTTEECRAEWDTVLKYEYMEDDSHETEPEYQVQAFAPASTTTQTIPQRSTTHLTSLVDPDIERDHSSTTSRLSHLDPTPPSLLDTRSTYHFALNDYANADITTPRLGDMFVGDAGDPRPVNRPLQVQPARPEDPDLAEEDPLVQGFGTPTSKDEHAGDGSRRTGEADNAGSTEHNEQAEELVRNGEGSAERVTLGTSLAHEVGRDPAP